MVTAVWALLVHAQSPRAQQCRTWKECAVNTPLTREVILYKKVPTDRLDSSCMSQSWLSRRLGLESPERQTAGSSYGRFLARVTWNGRTHHKYGWHLPVAAQIKGGSRKKLRFSPACLHVSCQAHLPAAAAAIAILQGHQNLSLPTWTEDVWLSWNHQAFSTRTGLLRYLTFYPEKPPGSQSLSCEDSHSWTTQTQTQTVSCKPIK